METLPVEILHRIFDNLDVETILFSIRLVSKLFHSVVNIYDRYNINMRLISKLKFHIISRLINPSKIISLTLKDDEQTPNQISLFIGSFRLKEFTRLRSLNLLNIDEDQLNNILKEIDFNCLTTFCFIFRNDEETLLETTTNLLSSRIKQSNLRKLELNMNNNDLAKILFPKNFSIQYLTINNNIRMKNLCTILQNCSHLHTLSVKLNYDHDIPSISFKQLKSLSIEDFNGTMNELEPFLLLTPSLIYFKLIDGRQMLNGKRWEEFIQNYLPHLNKFEFYFHEWDYVERTHADIQLFVDSFGTPFWIEQKKWFIACDYGIRGTYIYLYSIPICKSYFEYEPAFRKNLISTVIQDNSIMMNNIKSLKLSLDEAIVNDIHEKKKSTTNLPLFSNVTEIELEICHSWSLKLLESLPILINISKISQIIWDGEQYDDCKKEVFVDLGIFLEQVENLSSLFIRNCSEESCENIDKICSFIPHRIKYLQIPLMNFKQVKTILKRCTNLITIQLDCEKLSFAKRLINWFNDNTIHSSCHRDDGQIKYGLER